MCWEDHIEHDRILLQAAWELSADPTEGPVALRAFDVLMDRSSPAATPCSTKSLNASTQRVHLAR